MPKMMVARIGYDEFLVTPEQVNVLMQLQGQMKKLHRPDWRQPYFLAADGEDSSLFQSITVEDVRLEQYVPPPPPPPPAPKQITHEAPTEETADVA